MFQFSFERLDVWQNARDLSLNVYKATREFPISERDYLIDEIKTSAVKVGSKLAFGSAMQEQGDKANTTSESLEYLMRLLNLLTVAHDLSYLEEAKFNELRNKIFGIQKQLKALRNKQLEPVEN